MFQPTEGDAESPRRETLRSCKPRVVGSACFIQVRPAINVRRCFSASATSGLCNALQITCDQIQCLPQLQHAARIDDVLAARTPINEVCGVPIFFCHQFGQLFYQRYSQIALAGSSSRESREPMRAQLARNRLTKAIPIHSDARQWYKWVSRTRRFGKTSRAFAGTGLAPGAKRYLVKTTHAGVPPSSAGARASAPLVE